MFEYSWYLWKSKTSTKVTVKALDEKGQSVYMDGTGLLARAFCHEIDHLDGILFIDKAIPGSIVNQNNLISEAEKQMIVYGRCLQED
jgi:peptide deformylase